MEIKKRFKLKQVLLKPVLLQLKNQAPLTQLVIPQIKLKILKQIIR
jgi:hypothetical protein